MSGVRDDAPLYLADGRCKLCGQTPAERPPHTAEHLADGSAIVVIRDGRDVVRTTYEMPDDPEAEGLTDDVGEDVARRAIAEQYAHKHRGIRLPRRKP